MIHSASSLPSIRPLANRDFRNPSALSLPKTSPFLVKCKNPESDLSPKPQPIKIPRQNLTLQKYPEIPLLCDQIEKLVFFKRFDEALELFEILQARSFQSVKPSTYDALIGAIIGSGSIKNARILPFHMGESGFVLDSYMRNRVLLMQVKLGMIDDARLMFEGIPEKNILSFNIMISGLVDSGNHFEAFELFRNMWNDDYSASSRTFAYVIRAIAGIGRDSSGRELHACVIKLGFLDDIFISCALIDMYSKCGSIVDARQVFNEMPEKTVVGWNTIIAGYALHGYSEDAFSLYNDMRFSGVKMDHFTFSIIIRICARLASLEHAKEAHAGVIRNGFSLDIVASTSLIDLYSKWGKMEDAQKVFDQMPWRNLISWNALIGGYSNHGEGTKAIAIFDRMLLSGMVPNHVTYLAVLSACAYSGLIEKGWEIFQLMTLKHRIKPRAMHYTCMIEMLGREGRLEDAFSLIEEAPFPPTANMWAALLTACRIHKNLELGKLSAEKLYGIEPEKLSNYVVLLNIYYGSGRREEAAKVLETLRRKRLRICPASSWIEIKKQPYRFFFGDKTHPRSDEIYRRLEEILGDIRKMGYSPEVFKESLLPDVGEGEDQMRKYHSEKLAVVFGIMSTPNGTPLQIVQGHRICSDCHVVIKMISRIAGRYIVIRDASRFHHFKDGSCSCGDYW